MLISPGTRLRRYEVTASIGAGGMGEVYLARDVELDRTVAVKVLPQSDDAGGEERIRRFVQEARAAITLNHPNVAHIYDVGEENGVRFMAMEYVEGETLRARMLREPLSLDAALEIATQIANALGSAHGAGIIHRDIKPENVMLRPDGYVKVLDFGLAKLNVRSTERVDDATMVVHTEPGIVMGTMHYMSPEQLRGDDVDARADVFSLGVLLYEMVSGHRPFEGSSASGIIAAILTEEPPALSAEIPHPVRAIIARALGKNRNARFENAREMAAALKQAHGDTHRIRSGDVPTEAISAAVQRRSLPVRKIAIAAVLLIAIVIGAWFANRARLVREARAALPKIEQLAEQRRYFDAYDLAMSVQPRLRGDERLVRALEKITAPITVTTNPPGAQMWIERVQPDGETGPRMLVGTTPLQNHAIARGDYVLTIEKGGFAPVSRTISLTPVFFRGLRIAPPLPPLERDLVPAQTAPHMAAVNGGPYRLTSWSRPTTQSVTLAPYFVDRYEVSNADFARFVDGGGYQRPELWKHPFVKDGRTLSFDEAMTLLRDTTNLNAPRGWARQEYPRGRESDPVTGVTWYEAAAFAEFSGKALPTVFEWEKAARDGDRSVFGLTFPWGVAPSGVDVSRRANFRGNGPMPVDSMRAGQSPYGAHHMAGNVAEWCVNAFDDGRTVAGGSYDSPTYQFGVIGMFPPFYSSPDLGFRCVKRTASGSEAQGNLVLRRNAEVPVFARLPEAKYREFLKFYEYPPAPLNARVIERKVEDAWITERIAYAGANGQTVHAYLILPKNHKPPYQVVHYLPAGDVAGGMRSLEASLEGVFEPFLRNGRAAFGVMLPGYIGRDYPGGHAPPPDSDESAELTVNNIIDERRGLDYLLTRPDIDGSRIAFYGQSSGADVGIVLAGVEHRYRSVLIVGLGVLKSDSRGQPHVSRINFAPYVDTPLLMVHGRWDEGHPLRTDAEPIYNLFPQPKKMSIYDGGHIPPLEVAIPTFTTWWDETLGPVQR